MYMGKIGQKSAAFINHKPFHPGSYRNLEKVWIAEQKHQEQLRRQEELLNQRQQEGKIEELRKALYRGSKPCDIEWEGQHDVVTDNKVEWMYSKPGMSSQDPQETEKYLLLRENSVKEPPTPPGHIKNLNVQKPSNISNEDYMRKMREDPCFIIRQTEEQHKKSMKANPILCAKLQEKQDEKLKRKHLKREKKRLEKVLKQTKKRLWRLGYPDHEDSSSADSSTDSIRKQRGRSPVIFLAARESERIRESRSHRDRYIDCEHNNSWPKNTYRRRRSPSPQSSDRRSSDIQFSDIHDRRGIDRPNKYYKTDHGQHYKGLSDVQRIGGGQYERVGDETRRGGNEIITGGEETRSGGEETRHFSDRYLTRLEDTGGEFEVSPQVASENAQDTSVCRPRLMSQGKPSAESLQVISGPSRESLESNRGEDTEDEFEATPKVVSANSRYVSVSRPRLLGPVKPSIESLQEVSGPSCESLKANRGEDSEDEFEATPKVISETAHNVSVCRPRLMTREKPSAESLQIISGPYRESLEANHREDREDEFETRPTVVSETADHVSVCRPRLLGPEKPSAELLHEAEVEVLGPPRAMKESLEAKRLGESCVIEGLSMGSSLGEMRESAKALRELQTSRLRRLDRVDRTINEMEEKMRGQEDTTKSVPQFLRKARCNLVDEMHDRVNILKRVKIDRSLGMSAVEADIPVDISTKELKEEIEKRVGIPVAEQRLVYRGCIVKEADTLVSLKVVENATIYVTRMGVKPSETASATSVSAATTTPPGGAMPGGAMPGGFPGGMPSDMAGMMQMFQNPMVQNMIQSLSQNPAMIQSMLSNSSMLQNMAQSNPMLRETLNDPEAIANMLNPESMNRAAQALGQQQNTAEAGNLFGNMERMMQDPAIQQQMNSMLSQLGGITTADSRPANERFADQLSQLEEMGFLDRDANIQVLQQMRGDVNASINILLERGFGN